MRVRMLLEISVFMAQQVTFASGEDVWVLFSVKYMTVVGCRPNLIILDLIVSG